MGSKRQKTSGGNGGGKKKVPAATPAATTPTPSITSGGSLPVLGNRNVNVGSQSGSQGGTTMFSVRTGKVATPEVPPEVVLRPVESRSIGSNETNNCGELYEELRRKGRMGSESMLACDLVSYVRNDLFTKLKFIMDPRQLMYSTSKNSICYQICNDMGLTDGRAAAWWELYKNKLVANLNSKRADVTSAIKRTFMSKLRTKLELLPFYHD
jgi:hypothetical protein